MIIPTLVSQAPGYPITSALWNGTVVGGLQAAQNPVIFKGYATTTQTITSSASTGTPVLLDTEEFDTDGGHSTTTNTSRYTCQTAGVFQCFGYAIFATATTGQMGAEILKNGSGINGGMGQIVGATSANPSLSTTNLVRLAVGDYVELGIWHTSSGSLATSVTSARTSPTLIVIRVSN